ncbi:hypothetical protein [Halomarina pelagica]|uniref:hypothetical protein n=1 Tax=Halomarina pelagica TaxID=2961599 RepID=UPI0020C48297|nr:hypothetical protein [Halomarina sp. BND7]
MLSFVDRLAAGWEDARAHLPLALVPLLTALLHTDKIAAVLAADGTHFGVRLGLPATVVDLWGFVSVPNEGVNVDLGGPVGFPLALIVLPLALAIRAGLAAGYFGSVRDALATGSYDFAANARRYFVPFLVYTFVPVLLLLPLVLLGLSGARGVLLPLVVVLVPVVAVVTYLFYATPYILVLRETDLVSAARASYALALAGGPYLYFAVGFAAFVLLVSAVATAVVVNLGAVGVALGAIVAAPVGLAANATAMRFVADVDPESPPFGAEA